MMIPTIHKNGTSAETLIEEAIAASDALYLAIRALESMTVNGRDYYPQGASALGLAEKEHADRIARIVAVRGEICAYLEAISDASDSG